MFTLREINGVRVPLNVCYTIVDKSIYLQRFLNTQKKYEIKPYPRDTKRYDYVLIRGNMDVRRKEGHDYYILAKLGRMVRRCFTTAQEMWDWANNRQGLGLRLEELELFMKRRPICGLFKLLIRRSMVGRDRKEEQKEADRRKLTRGRERRTDERTDTNGRILEVEII